MVILLFLAIFSLVLSHFTFDSDFPLYYYAARTIIDPNSPNESIYLLDTFNRFSLPEHVNPPAFIYSMGAAYLLAPLAFMPYYLAKAMMILLNVVTYVGALFIIARLNGASGRSLFYPVVLSCLWLPFLQNLRAGQVNALMLVMVAIAVFWAINKKPVLCGIFIGIASLFKLFPFVIAMVLGLKNWRIVVACALFFCSTLLLPGSLAWFDALGDIYKIYTPFFPKLTNYGMNWYLIYVLIIAGTTAFIAYRCKGENNAILISFAIPAGLLIMPIIHYYHLTLLIFTYIYIITSENRTNRLLITANILSALLISLSFFFTPVSSRFVVRPYLSYTFLMIGLFLTWVSLAWKLYRNPYIHPA